MTLAERFARLYKEALALQVLFAQLQKKVKLAHKVQYNQNGILSAVLQIWSHFDRIRLRHFKTFEPKNGSQRIVHYENQKLNWFKGIVSRDFEWLQMIIVDRLCVPDVPLKVYSFLYLHLHIVF